MKGANAVKPECSNEPDILHPDLFHEVRFSAFAGNFVNRAVHRNLQRAPTRTSASVEPGICLHCLMSPRRPSAVNPVIPALNT